MQGSLIEFRYILESGNVAQLVARPLCMRTVMSSILIISIGLYHIIYKQINESSK
jgi:hypothetical protein